LWFQKLVTTFAVTVCFGCASDANGDEPDPSPITGISECGYGLLGNRCDSTQMETCGLGLICQPAAGEGCDSGICQSVLHISCANHVDCSDGDDRFDCIDGACQPANSSHLFPTECGDGAEGSPCGPFLENGELPTRSRCGAGLVCFADDTGFDECLAGRCLRPEGQRCRERGYFRCSDDVDDHSICMNGVCQ